MSANKIKINDQEKFYGGFPIKCSFVAEFGGPSRIDIDFASEDGNYTINQNRLSTERGDKISIPFEDGYKDVWMLPIRYEKTKDATSRILRVSYVDYSKIYLDKHLVLIKGKHTNQNIDRVLTVGKVLDKNGKVLDSGTTEQINNQDDIKYKFSDLIAELIRNKVPISSKLLGLTIDPYLDMYQDFSGTLRSVLSSWSAELNLFFYWDCLGNEGVNQNKIGYLDVINVSKQVNNLINIKSKVAELENLCSASSSSEYNSLENNFANASVIYSSDEASSSGTNNGFEKFFPLNLFDRKGQCLVLKDIFGQYVKLDLRTYTKDGKTVKPHEKKETVTPNPTQDEKDLLEMLRAAALGESFYRYYVLLKLMMRNKSGDSALAPEYSATETRTPDLDPESTKPFPDASTKALLDSEFNRGEESWAVSKIYRNALLEKLYGCNVSGDYKTRAAPIFFLESFSESNWAARTKATDIKQQTKQLLSYLKKDKRDFYQELKAGIQTGIMIGAITINKYIYNICKHPERDIVYRGLRDILEYQDRFWYSDELITSKNKSKRNYADNVSEIYAGLGIGDTEFSELFYYKNETNTNESIEILPQSNKWSISLNGEAPNWRITPYISDYDSERETGESCDGYSNMPHIAKFFSELKKVLDKKVAYIDLSNGESCSRNGKDQIDAKRNAKENKTWPTDSDFLVTYLDKKSTQRDLKIKSEDYELGDFGKQPNLEGVTDGTEVSNIFKFYAPFNATKFLVDLNKVQNLPRIGVIETILYCHYTTQPGDEDKFSYGLSSIPNLRNDKISEIRFVDHTTSEAQLLSLIGQVDTNEESINRDFIIDAVKKLAIAYQKLDMKEPSYGATLRFNGLPNFALIPSIEQGMESFNLEYSGSSIEFSINIGNNKRNQEKLETIFRIIQTGENMTRNVRIGSRIERFSTEWKSYTRN